MTIARGVTPMARGVTPASSRDVGRTTPLERMCYRWKNLKAWCFNPRSRHYSYYGAVGVTMWAPWVASFERFVADVGFPPAGKRILDRIDKAQGFEPGNVRWATSREMALGRTSQLRLVTYRGETLPIAEWARRLKIDHGSLSGRLELGWTVEEAFQTPVDARFQPWRKEDPAPPKADRIKNSQRRQDVGKHQKPVE